MRGHHRRLKWCAASSEPLSANGEAHCAPDTRPAQSPGARKLRAYKTSATVCAHSLILIGRTVHKSSRTAIQSIGASPQEGASLHTETPWVREAGPTSNVVRLRRTLYWTLIVAQDAESGVQVGHRGLLRVLWAPLLGRPLLGGSCLLWATYSGLP